MRSVGAHCFVDYREHPVPEALRSHVAGLWQLRDAAATSAVQTIYPDGFCELIVHLGEPPECHDEGGWHEQAHTLFASQRLSAVRLRRHAPLDCFGVRLQPHASNLLGDHTLRASRERIVDLAAIDAPLSCALRAAAPALLAGDAHPLWEALRPACARHSIDAIVARAVADIREAGGQERIESLAARVGCGVRALQMRFGRAVGLTLKEFSRLVRLQAMLRALDGDDRPVVDVASDVGFADQAHATRELRRATGLAPARLRAALRIDRDGDAAVRLAAAFVRGRS
jgi:AraC-like DNA-binding protein